MRPVFAAALICSLLPGCYLGHEASPPFDPPADPPADPPRGPPPPGPPPTDPPAPPEGFVFLRASEPGSSPIRSPDRWLHLETGSWRSTQIVALDSRQRLSEQHADEGVATLRRSDRPGTMHWSGRALSGPGIEGPSSVAGVDGSVLYFPADEIIRTNVAGDETGRWALPGAGAFTDPDHLVVVRGVPPVAPDEPSERVAFLDLFSSELRIVTTGVQGSVLRVFFGGSHIVLALAALEADFEPVTHELVAVSLDTFDVTHLDTSELTVAAYDRCADTLLTIDTVGRVIAIDARTGRRSEVGPPIGVRPYETYRPFAALAALSPDGQHLVWLGNADDGVRALVVTDLRRGLSEVVGAMGLPAPWGCCDLREIDATLGSFRDGYLAIGVGARGLVPICSCAGPDHPAPTAYRLQLEPVALVEFPHCGRSIPWMLEDGAMLVCEEDDSERVRLAVADEASLMTVTDGPWDVSALPLHREDRLGCAAP